MESQLLELQDPTMVITKIDLYRRLSLLLGDAMKVTSKNMASRLSGEMRRLNSELVIVGSDEVLIAYTNWIEISRQKGSDPKEIVTALADLMQAMRKDIHRDSKVSREQILSNFFVDLNETKEEQ